MSDQPVSRRERLLSRLESLSADPKRSLGQNFLISDVVIDRIVTAARSQPFNELIEVGPGLGAITEDLIQIAREQNVRMTVIELDQSFAEVWKTRGPLLASAPREALAEMGRNTDRELSNIEFRVFENDALKVDWNSLDLKPGTLFVSNLPYQISSSILVERSVEPAGITRMILMFQKEVAQRIAAKFRTEQYGLLTVIAQTFWKTQTVSDAGPRDFHPPPNVASRVLMFTRRSTIFDDGSHSSEGFLKFVKAAFSHRRKLLSKNLVGEYFRGRDASKIEPTFVELGLKPTARAEELDPETFVRLYQALRLE